jgi:threonine/homoserine/homoserine lactone efflux protein
VTLEPYPLLDTVIIIGITIFAVGGVKLGYALMVDQARLLVNSKTRKIINIVAGVVMIAVGLFLITKV